MTKKDYELIANELRSQHELLGYNGDVIAGDGKTTVYECSCKLWAQTLAQNDKLFNRSKFLKACGLEV